MFNETWRREYAEDIAVISGGLKQTRDSGIIGAIRAFDASASLLRLASDGSTAWEMDLSRRAGMTVPRTVEETIADGYIIGGTTGTGQGGAINLV